MNKKIVIAVCAIILIIIGVIVIIKMQNNFDKSNPIIYEASKTEDYRYIINKDKRYVPYSAINPTKRGSYLGYIGDDKTDEIYTFKQYSQDEWLISYSNGEAMLLKEQNTTNIQENLTSEYEWNN